MKKNTTLKIIILFFIIWIFLLIYSYFSGFKIENFFDKNNYSLELKIFIIFLLYFFRNYLLVPSTFLILLTGYLLQNFYLSFFVSLIWVWIWIIQTYFVGKTIWEEFWKNKRFKRIKIYQEKFKKNWFKFIFFSTLVPILPVDIIYYAAASTNYDFKKFFLAGILWELPLIILYSYLWKDAEKYSNLIILSFIILWLLYLIYLFFENKKTKN